MISSLKKLWWLLSRREKRNAFLLTLLQLINGLFEMVGVGIVPVYVSIVAFPEKVIDNQYVRMFLSEPGEVLTQTMLLYWGSALVLSFFTLKAAYTIVLSYWQTRFVQNRVLRIGEQLFTAYMKAPYDFHLGRNTAQLLRNVNFEARQIGHAVLIPLVDFTMHLFVLVMIVGLLVVAAPGLATLSLMIVTIVAVVVVGALHRKFKELGIKAQTARGDVVRSAQEGLGGVKEIKVLQRELAFTKRYSRSLKTTLLVQRFMQVVHQAIPVMMEWISIVGLLAVVLVLFSMGKPIGTVTSIIVLFAVSLVRLKKSVGTLVRRYTEIQHNLVSLDVVYDDLQQLNSGQGAKGLQSAVKLKEPREGQSGSTLVFRKALEMKGITYHYAGADNLALKNVSLTIEKGEAVGFIGATGAGKSTLIDVVLGVLTPTSGEVLVDGENIYEDIGAWQRNVGYIPQSIYLVDGSIKENIALGMPANLIDDQALKQALKAAHLEEFVNELPGGVDSVVGERGVRVSGGQRQRVAIARALYHNPDVLIMDEATSALDNVTEKAVIEAVEELKGQRTILMIAHRLSTVKKCDRIVMLDHGEIIAIGTYDALMEQSAEFRKMVEA